MTQRNSVLLIVKQNNGLDYNSLLNRIRANYSSLNSARAALSRTVRELTSFGLIKRQGENFFITDKGSTQIGSEMKTKLLEKLNQLVKSKNNYLEIDSIVQYLHTLIERSKQDTDLLKAARGAVDFYLTDLEDIHENIEKQKKHLEYINKILSVQIASLKKLDFNSLKQFPLDFKHIEKAKLISKKVDFTEFSVGCSSHNRLEKLSKEFNSKIEKETITLKREQFSRVIEFACPIAVKSRSNFVLTVYLPNVVLKITNSRGYLIGKAKEIEKLI